MSRCAPSFSVSDAHSDVHSHLTLQEKMLNISDFISLMSDIHQRALMCSALSHMNQNFVHAIFIELSDSFFLNSTMPRKLKQIDRSIDHTGAYFQ